MFHELSKIKFVEQNIPPEVERELPALFNGYKDVLVSSAISASKRAKHWDKQRAVPMHVGCSLLILENGFDLSEPKIVTGANTKESPEMLAYPERQCAEMAAKNNALTERKQFSQEDIDLEKKGEEIQEGNLREQGFIAVIVTASPSRNTGEADTQSHGLVHPCKQCQENYKLLLKEKRVSPQTIICSVRIDKDKVISEHLPLGELLEKLEKENKDKEERSIKELQTLFQKQVQIFLAAMSPFDEELEKRRIAFLKISGKTGEKPDYERFSQNLDRERRERAFSLFDEMEFRRIMLSAIKSVTEEGVPKIKALSALLPPERVDNIVWDRGRPDLSGNELKEILDVLCNRLLYLSRNPEETI
jgi:hypothetical protein